MGCCKTTDRGAGPKHTVSVENHGDATYEATTRHSTFLMGTDGRGASPVDTLLASLCACVGHYVRDYLDGANLAAARFTVKAGATSTPDGARLASIDVQIEVKGVALDDRQRAELLRAAEHCKIHNTLKAACDVRLGLGLEPRAVPAPEATPGGRPACCS